MDLIDSASSDSGERVVAGVVAMGGQHKLDNVDGVVSVKDSGDCYVDNSFVGVEKIRNVVENVENVATENVVTENVVENVENVVTKQTSDGVGCKSDGWCCENGVDNLDVIAVHNEVVKSGCHNYRGCRIPVRSGLNIPVWKQCLRDYSDKRVVSFLEYGWPLGVTKPVEPFPPAKNHTGALHFSKQVDQYLADQVSKGRVLGPFSQPIFPGSVLSPLNTVPKKGSVERRVILDLSYPPGSGLSVNDAIPKDSYLGVPGRLHLPSVDNLVSLVKIQGKGCLLYKRDLKQAYRQIPIDPGDMHLVGYCHKRQVFYDRVFSMGLRSSCQGCQRMTDAVVYIFDIRGFKAVNYIDDIAGAESGQRATEGFVVLSQLLSELGLVESTSKACEPNVIMSFLGIEFNTVTGTLSIPDAKLQEILLLLRKWLGRSRATKKQVQSVIGSLNFMAACVRPGRVFMARLINCLRGMPDAAAVKLSPCFQQDIKWWSIFAPRFNGVALMPLSDWSSPDAGVACDACLLGCGGWNEEECQYFHSPFPHFISSQSLHINALELLTLVVAIRLWGSQWRGKRIKLYCDNYTSVIVINTGKSKDVFLQSCLREICYLSACLECEFRAVHLPGASNRLPDLLSRWELSDTHRQKIFKATSHLPTKYCSVSEELFNFSHEW